MLKDYVLLFVVFTFHDLFLVETRHNKITNNKAINSTNLQKNVHNK